MNNSQPRTSLHEQLHCIHPQHTHSPCTAICTTHPAIPSQLPSTTLLCTQLTNTKHSWQNGTRCRDGINVLWCRSHLVWLIFEGSIPTWACFHSENFFVTCSYTVIVLDTTQIETATRQLLWWCYLLDCVQLTNYYCDYVIYYIVYSPLLLF